MKPYMLSIQSILYISIIIGSLSPFMIRSTYAIPVFARKYETSCTTCHSAFPKLNAFGESFRIAGYQIPEGDEEFIKQDQIALGNEAYKRVWPESIWPSSMTPSIPLALRAIVPLVAKIQTVSIHSESSSAENSSVETTTSNNDENHDNSASDNSSSSHSHGLTKSALTSAHSDDNDSGSSYMQFTTPTAVNIYSAGNIGDNISLWLGAHLFENGNPGTLGKLSIQFSNLLEPLLPHQLLNIKFGFFVPSYLAFDHHRNITYGTSLMASSDPVNGAPKSIGHVHESSGGHTEGGDTHNETITGAFSLGSAKTGSEISGLIGSKFEYIFGVLNGNAYDVGVTNKGVYQFPFYIRTRLKIGGMGFDGSFQNAGTSTTSQILSLSSDENSIIIGGFSYFGMNHHQAQTLESSRFYENMVRRYGGDIQLHFSNFEIFSQFVYGQDSNALGNNSMIQSLMYFGQIDWILPWPWIIATARYESANFSSDINIHPENARQMVFEVTTLLRANFRAQLENVIDLKRDSNTRSDYVALVFDTSF